MKKVFKIIIPVAITALIIIAVVIHHYSTRIIFNEEYVNGNTQGNLYNEGTFCEYNGTIYFANPDDSYKLYSMDMNGKNLKKLCDDSVFYINVDENYIYYVRNNQEIKSDYFFFSNGNNSLCRIKRNGGKATVLDSDPCMYASLCGNYIYYLHYDKTNATSLYKIRIDGKDKQMVQKTPIYTCGALGQYIYYNGMESDGNLYELDTATDKIRTVIECNCYKPIVTSPNNIFYLDVNKNNALMHTGVNAEQPTKLSGESIDLFNVYGSTIYFQTYDEKAPGLYMVKNDGSDLNQIYPGVFKRINITSNYIYFTDFKTGTVYFTSTSNPGMIEEFHPGKK